ncbi:hypothetical protein KL942_003848 [Ogataea angusta]|uniref:J domain-containing protein n=1 Tax=Pichia angusta TaxID=870730 RepID=A0ABQ7RVE9_PICAN|nr:hypothetical protein KL942_003848 [Ogataea angusta]KAG7848542.1 hypothetical protein KL940_003397 [Ogataea angusta]
MAQVTQEDFSWLLSRSKSAYQLLDVDTSVQSQGLRRAYRKKALVLHPDKNQSSDAEEQFREILVSYRVLDEPEWRKRYDEHLETELERQKARAQQSAHQKSLKEQLLFEESRYRQDQSTAQYRQVKIEQLRRETEQLRRAKLRETASSATIVETDKSRFPCKVRVRWKSKPQITDLVSAEVVQQLMEVFGEVVSVQMNSSTDAAVTYKTWLSAVLAATHDYSQVSDLWDERKTEF